MRIFFLIVALTCVGVSADAATVYLKDGGRLQGSVLSSTAQGVQLQTTDGVTVRISSDRIDHIDYSQGAAPAPAPAPQVQPAPNEAPPAYPAPAPYPRYRRRFWIARQPSFEDAPNELSLDIGVSAPVSNISFSGIGGGSDRDGDAGGTVGIQWIHYLDPQFGIGADFHYLGRSWSDSESLISGYDTSVSGGSAVFMGVAKFRIIPDGPVRPYLLGGLGVHNTSETIDSRPLFSNPVGWPDTGTYETRRLYDANSTGLATTIKFGVDFQAFPPTFFGFDLGWTGLFNGKYNPTAEGSSLGFGTLSGTLSIFSFGAHAGWRF